MGDNLGLLGDFDTAYRNAQGRLVYAADAHKPVRMRCVVRAGTPWTACMELRGMVGEAKHRAPRLSDVCSLYGESGTSAFAL